MEARFENYGRSCVRDTGNKSAKFSNLASTGIKPVGGRKNSGAVRVVVGKPGFHRHEAGWGTLDSVQQTIRSGIQVFNSSHSIKTKFKIPPLSTDWTDRTPLPEAGIPLRLIQQYLGHSSLQTTMIYLHLTHTAAVDALRVINGLFRRPRPNPPEENGGAVPVPVK